MSHVGPDAPGALSPFDRLPPFVQHLALLLAPVLLGWVATQLVPVLQDRSPLVASLVGSVVGVLLATLTPLTRTYGVGQPKPPT